VLRDAVADLPGEVQAAAVVFQDVDDAQALLAVVEAAWHQRVDDALARVAEWRVAQVVTKGNRFGQLFVQPEHLRDRPGDLRHLERMRQPGPVVISGRREEHLGLVLQSAKRLAMNDAVAIALKGRTNVVFLLRPETTARIRAPGGLRASVSRSRCSSCSRIVTARSREESSCRGARRPTSNISASV